MPYPYDDYRTFAEECEKNGSLVRIEKEVDWNLEASAISRRLAEMGRGRPTYDGGTPAVLFENVKGYPKGFRLAGQQTGGIERIAMAMGYDLAGKTASEMKEGLVGVVEKAIRNPIKPVLVDKADAPCKQNIMMGDDIDLYKFPVPMLHDGDGGRYFSTWGAVITKDPDTGWVNWGMYRAMLIDKNTLAGIIEYRQDIGKHYQKYEERNEPMPIAIAIGPDPISFAVSGAGVLPGQDEVDVVGGIRGKPVKMVKCETIDLEVPAGAEIVIEATVPPRKRVWEGPYGEYTGYRASPRDLRPIYNVSAVTYRDDPILTFNSTGTPVSDFGSSFFTAAFSNEALRKVGINARAWLMPESGYTFCTVAVKRTSPNIATMIKNTLTSQQGLMAIWTFKFLIVNDDVDIYDPAEVLWALSTRVHPRTGIIVSDEICGPLTPFASLDERLKRNAPHVTLDGTWPLDWHPTIAVPPVASFRSIFPKEVQEKVLGNWEEYGL
jgi:4-hydroxy-3-polyprenylbenzoate decarboxylase